MTDYVSGSTLGAVAGALPRVHIVHPGTVDVTTYNTASGTIEPGDLVELVSAAASQPFYTQGGRARKVTATPSFASGDARKRYGVGMKQVQVLDQVTAASLSDGPMELVNAAIVDGEFVRIVHDGTLATTVVKPDDAFTPGDLLCYDPSEARPSGYTGTGSWKITADASEAFAEVVSFTAVGTDDGGILYMRLLS